MTWMMFLAIGLAAGVLAGLFGIGGGILIIPALVVLAGMDQQTANGTSLGALLLPVGALGAWQYYRRGHVNVAASLWLALGLFAGAYVGARLTLGMTPEHARRAFSVFLAAVAVMLWFR